MPPYLLPSPPPFESGPIGSWGFFILAGGLVVAVALPWSIRCVIKDRNWLPLIAIAGGALCSLVEPMVDILGHLRWARDLPVAFTNFGIDIPWAIPPAYAAFYGLESYFFYYVLKRGITVKQSFMVYLVGIVTDAIVETFGLNMDVYEYYGVQPYRLFEFPYWWGFLNGASFFVVGFFMWFLAPRVAGFWRILLVLSPPSGMMAGYFIAGWPHILALNSDLPEWAKWGATTLTMVMCVGLVRGIAYFAAVPEQTMEWTVPRLFAFRFMMPSARERMMERMSEESASDGASASPRG